MIKLAKHRAKQKAYLVKLDDAKDAVKDTVDDVKSKLSTDKKD